MNTVELKAARQLKFDTLINELRTLFDKISKKFDEILDALTKKGVIVDSVYHFTYSRTIYFKLKKGDKILNEKDIKKLNLSHLDTDVGTLRMDGEFDAMRMSYYDELEDRDRSKLTTQIINSVFGNLSVHEFDE